MIAAADVYYFDDLAVAAAILFDDWGSEHPTVEIREDVSHIEPYTPGLFYKRELPCLIKVLEEMKNRFEIVVIDGYVWLNSGRHPGLGAHLYQVLGEKIPVIGVAKTKFKRAAEAVPVLRGRSHRALYVTAVGINLDMAAKHIETMHGRFRIPTLLKKVDLLCRDPRYVRNRSNANYP